MGRTGGRAQLDDGGIMTCEEVARFLKVHVSSVRRWSRGGLLRAYKVGGRGDWRYLRQDVLMFLYNGVPNERGDFAGKPGDRGGRPRANQPRTGRRVGNGDKLELAARRSSAGGR